MFADVSIDVEPILVAIMQDRRVLDRIAEVTSDEYKIEQVVELLDVEAIAQAVEIEYDSFDLDYGELADNISLHDLSREFDYTEFEIDYSDLSVEVSLHQLADEIDTEDLVDRLEHRVADLLDDRIKLDLESTIDELQEQLNRVTGELRREMDEKFRALSRKKSFVSRIFGGWK